MTGIYAAEGNKPWECSTTGRSIRWDVSVSDKITKIRAALPALSRAVYLNCGTSGPIPAPAATAMSEAVQDELAGGRTGQAYFSRALGEAEAVRELVAGLLGADPSEIALTAGASEGMNIAAWALNWQRGDEVVSANTEHPGGLFPLFALRDRFGVNVRLADWFEPGQDVVATLERLITPRTRLVALSHVAWSTGERCPIADVAALAHAHGALLLVDGAQGAGAAPLHLHESGVDFYALPGQKWLLGPEGTGALYVRADRLPELRNTFAGYGSAQAWNRSAGFLPHAAARRFEVGMRHPVSIAGQKAALTWMRETVEISWAVERIDALAERLRQRLAAIPGVRVITPAGHAGLVAFQVPNVPPADAVHGLERRGYWVRFIDLPPAVRASCGFYNTEDEIDGLAAAVEELARGRP